jgi:hypothetical protein
VEDKVAPPPSPPLGLKQMPTPTVATRDMQWARFFGYVSMQKVRQLNVQSCELFGSSEQLHSIMMGV